VFVDYDEGLLEPALYGQSNAEYERLFYAVEAALRFEVGSPAFIRTDLTSAKHSGKSAYKVESFEDLNDALLKTLSAAFLKSYHSKVKSSSIMVRSFINIRHDRTAFKGLPIGNEWRIFADQQGIQCSHRYWPKEALEGNMDNGANLPEQPTGYPHGWLRTDMLDAARAAARAMNGLKWSIDFAEDVNGKFWLLDMATAMNSYHDPACKFSGLDNFERV